MELERMVICKTTLSFWGSSLSTATIVGERVVDFLRVMSCGQTADARWFNVKDH